MIIAGVPDAFVAMAPLGLMVLYFLGVSLTIANYSGYFRFNDGIYGTSFTRAYLVFTVLGTCGYFLVCGPAWLWAAKYCNTTSERTLRLTVGMLAIFALHDLPLFIMEWHAILCCGWLNPFQGFVFVVQFIEFIVSFSFGWLSYTYVMSGFLQRSQDGSGYFGLMSNGGLKTGADNIHILPPLSSAQTPMLRSPQPVFFPQPERQQQQGSPRSTGSRRDVRWNAGAASSHHDGASAVPLRETLADPAAYSGATYSGVTYSSNPRFGGGHGTNGGMVLQDSDTESDEGRRYSGGQPPPAEYSPREMHVIPPGYPAYGHGSPRAQQQQQLPPPRRLGSVFVERTVI
jgi:hypothetical protein